MRSFAALIAVVPNLLAPQVQAETTTQTFGPVVLHEDSRFEICANARYSEFNVQVTASFVRVIDGKELTRVAELDPGEGGCFDLPFEKVGKAPVFATLEVFGEPGDTDVVASAAVINGIFDMPKAQLVTEDDGLATATSFGPLVIAEGKRLQVCANNWRSTYPSEISVSFYRTKNADEPFLVTGSVLQPGEGGCTTLSQEVTGDESIFAELRTEPVEEGFSNPLPVTGAFVINGIFDEPLPPSLRYLPSD
jgi:hypothetical protein